VSASVFKRASVGSASNCGACHGHAADGDFNEHQVRIPK
jgi:cytochrome c553